MWSHSGMLTNYLVWAKEQLAELLLCFKSEGADSNRLSISISVLFSETPNSKGAKVSSSLWLRFDSTIFSEHIHDLGLPYFFFTL